MSSEILKTWTNYYLFVCFCFLNLFNYQLSKQWGDNKTVRQQFFLMSHHILLVHLKKGFCNLRPIPELESSLKWLLNHFSNVSTLTTGIRHYNRVKMGRRTSQFTVLSVSLE